MTKQIKIEEIIPYMNDGWLAMDKSETWHFFLEKPTIKKCKHCGYPYEWTTETKEKYNMLPTFNIAPAKDWTKSLIKVGGK